MLGWAATTCTPKQSTRNLGRATRHLGLSLKGNKQTYLHCSSHDDCQVLDHCVHLVSCCCCMVAADAASHLSEAHFIAGEVKYMSTGSAPISSEVFEFLRVCFGATVSEGYGMTESACTIAMTRPDDATIGHVGAPLECCEIKLEDIPDMNYKNTDQPYPRGEVNPTATFLHCICLKLLLEACMTSPDIWTDGRGRCNCCCCCCSAYSLL